MDGREKGVYAYNATIQNTILLFMGKVLHWFCWLACLTVLVHFSRDCLRRLIELYKCTALYITLHDSQRLLTNSVITLFEGLIDRSFDVE